MCGNICILLDIVPSLDCVKVLEEFGIDWNLPDSIQERNVDFQLLEHVKDFTRFRVLNLFLLKPLREGWEWVVWKIVIHSLG